MSETDDFDEVRRSGIGGSDAAAALGISPWQTRYGLYQQKIGEAPPVNVNEQMRWGSLLEPLIREEYTRRTGRDVKTIPFMMRHPIHRHMIAHLDGLSDKGRRVLEIKTARTAQGWGEPGSDEIPLNYLSQTHHYLVVAGAALADLCVLIGGSDFRIYEIRADADIARDLVTRELEFWWHVENRTPPEPSNLRDAVDRWGRLAARGGVSAGPTECLAVERLLAVRAEKKILEREADALQLQLVSALGEYGDCLFDENGELLATWKLDKGRKAFSVKERGPQRRFWLKGNQDG